MSAALLKKRLWHRCFPINFVKFLEHFPCKTPPVAASVKFINPLSANPAKWSNTLKEFFGKLPTNCLSLFDHFVDFALKGLTSLTTDPHFWSSTCMVRVEMITLQFLLLFVTKLFKAKILSNSSFVVFQEALFVSICKIMQSWLCFKTAFKRLHMSLIIAPK